jgi:hypothetical protein
MVPFLVAAVLNGISFDAHQYPELIEDDLNSLMPFGEKFKF